MRLSTFYIPEPLLAFGFDQKLENPKDGLFLFGPYDGSGGRSEVRVAVIGSGAGVGLSRAWLQRLAAPIAAKHNRHGAEVAWAPAWPGFEACFGVSLPSKGMAELSLDSAAIENAIKRENRSDAVRSTVLLYANAVREYLRTEERRPDVWIVVVPDVVYRYGRPGVAPPPKSERTRSTLLPSKVARRFFNDGDLFPQDFADAETYLFSSNFHHQLKAELLKDQVALQLVLESTLHDRELGLAQAGRRRGLQDEATVAWNFATTLYFKMDAKPWALSDVRAGVCDVGLVFKRDETPGGRGEACCAAQMFLNSGDGLVFRGALGPWYSDKTGEFHLSSRAADALMNSVVEGYKIKHGVPPRHLFIHGRHTFSRNEWEGFSAAVPAGTDLTGVRIQRNDDVRLFRPDATTPVLRGTALVATDSDGFLWARGYVPRLACYQGFETPKPLTIGVTHGTGELEWVLKDVLALTKVNYNSCDFASGLPVTLKFAERVGEILMASPRTADAPPLPFRFYV